MASTRFKKGDLIKSTKFTKNAWTEKPQDWFGVILETEPNAPRVYPIYAAKYKIRWIGGTSSWHFAADIKLIARAK